MIKKGESGFTLIELLIGSLLLVILTLLVNNILFNVFKGTAKSEVLKEVKQNGDYSLAVMERMIREAKKIDCSVSGQISLVSQDPDDSDQSEDRHMTTFKCSPSGGILRIASSSGSRLLLTPAVPQDLFLTNSESVTLTGGGCPGSLTFTCSQPVGKPPTVSISFTLRQKTPTGVTPRREEEAQIPFQTTVTLRNLP